MQFGDTLSPKDVDKLKYLSACMKESQRVTPTVNGISREQIQSSFSLASVFGSDFPHRKRLKIMRSSYLDGLLTV